MDRAFSRRLLLVAAFLVAVAGFSAAIGRYGWHQGLHQTADRGRADLLLATDRLSGQLQLFQQLAVVTADHPNVTRVLMQGVDGDLTLMLQRLADKTGALEVAVIRPDGTVLAAARGQLPPRLPATDWLRQGLHGVLGEGHGTAPMARSAPPQTLLRRTTPEDLSAFGPDDSATNGAGGIGGLGGWDEFGLDAGPPAGRATDGPGRAWMFAAPVFRDTGGVIGVVLVVVDIERVEAEWRGARPPIWFTDAAGRVFITNRSEIMGWHTEAGMLRPPPGPLAPASQRAVAGHSLWRTAWSAYIPGDALYLARDLPVLGLRAEALIETGTAWRLALLQAATVAAICLAFGAVLFLVLERRRTLMAANARLEARVAARTAELSAEVGERRAAELALQRAQADLVQAGKLSALGQMSAGISHELNQPLMAIQQFSDNARAYLDRGRPDMAADNLTRIADLARRMGRIIRNLRAFARQESEPAARVDLVAVIDAALELAAPRLQGVNLHWARPQAPVWVIGGEVRLGQVVVNLLTNAAEAMIASPVRAITITLRQNPATASPMTPGPRRVVMEVADTGPGIREPDRIFDPFYTTREVGAGEGLGLGLSISYGLVQSFGGMIRGRNHPAGGAVLTVELQACPEDVAHGTVPAQAAAE